MQQQKLFNTCRMGLGLRCIPGDLGTSMHFQLRCCEMLHLRRYSSGDYMNISERSTVLLNHHISQQCLLNGKKDADKIFVVYSCFFMFFFF